MIRPPIRPSMSNGFSSNGHDNINLRENHQSSESNEINGHTNAPS